MPPRPRLAVAVVSACAAAIAGYAVLRVAQRLAFGEPDPALVIYSEHAAYFWRAWIAAYFGVARSTAQRAVTALAADGHIGRSGTRWRRSIVAGPEQG